MLSFKSHLFVRLSLISFVQSILIGDLTVDWIVKHAILLYSSWELLDVVFAVVLLLFCQVCLEFQLSFIVNISDSHWVKIVRFPVLFSGLNFHNILVHLHLLLMMLQVSVIDHVIVSLTSGLNCFTSDSLQ